MSDRLHAHDTSHNTANRILLIGLPLLVTLGFCFGFGLYQHRPGGSMAHVDSKKTSTTADKNMLEVTSQPQYSKLNPAPQQPTTNPTQAPVKPAGTGSVSTHEKATKSHSDTTGVQLTAPITGNTRITNKSEATKNDQD